ncbi:hypothetical protein [Amycolatopsis saalfeldensis]|uniref:Uncharacterized protein n=1 Tax=Amycolatopsis saalfeldensis TaxID=394193 RepID=A0A1H8YR79_9PSEU|nr:hypothetical protein [Amycolatopsis saalfeldensis]SEP54562.1 hypothetical protein SAMN04489732_1567 [Amycolatopsis saalfeldensis]
MPNHKCLAQPEPPRRPSTWEIVLDQLLRVLGARWIFATLALLLAASVALASVVGPDLADLVSVLLLGIAAIVRARRKR